jgi:hypothetical protein
MRDSLPAALPWSFIGSIFPDLNGGRRISQFGNLLLEELSSGYE